MGDPGWEALKAQFWPGAQDAGHDAATLLSGAANGIVDTPQLIAHALKQFVAQSLQNTTGEGAETQPQAQLPESMQPGEFSPFLSPHLPQSEVRNGYDSGLKGYGNTIGQLIGPAVYGKGLEGLAMLEGSGDAAGAFGNQSGAIRLLPDYMDKDVAAARADQMLRDVEDVPDELRTALAKHILKHGGKADDPIDALPLQGENARTYGDIKDVQGDYYRVRAGQEELPKAGEGTWGAMMAQNLGFNPMSSKAIFAGRGPESLNNSIIRGNIERVFEDTGVEPQYWPKQYAEMPEDSVVFRHPDPDDGDWRSKNIFKDLVSNLDGTDLKGKSFADMVQTANQNYASVLREQLKKNKGEHVLDTGDGYNWQKLSPAQLEWEGDSKNMAHCIGGYCNDVESGGTNVYSLRKNDTNESKITLSTGNDRYRNMGRPDWLPYSSTQQPIHMVGQIKGKANAIRPEFASNVQQLADHLGLDLSDSGDWYRMNPELAAQKKLELQGEQIEPRGNLDEAQIDHNGPNRAWEDAAQDAIPEDYDVHQATRMLNDMHEHDAPGHGGRYFNNAQANEEDGEIFYRNHNGLVRDLGAGINGFH